MIDAPEFRYVGQELDLFATAANWKRYLASQIRPYLGADVLEVGAGLGATTRVLCSPDQRQWLALEPDAALAARATAARDAGELPASVHVRVGTLDSLGADERFDAVLYIDVLEHIEDDAAELRRAASHLRTGGHLIVLAPAHQWLFSPFDLAVGHHRRYTAASLKALAPPTLSLVRLRYLDSVGLIASAMNRLVLRQRTPTRRQMSTWDRVMVPTSRRLDRVAFFNAGKSVVGVWRR